MYDLLQLVAPPGKPASKSPVIPSSPSSGEIQPIIVEPISHGEFTVASTMSRTVQVDSDDGDASAADKPGRGINPSENVPSNGTGRGDAVSASPEQDNGEDKRGPRRAPRRSPPEAPDESDDASSVDTEGAMARLHTG